MTTRSNEVVEIIDNSNTLYDHVTRSSTLLLSFASTGNLKFYHDYISTRQSTARDDAISALRRIEMPTESIRLLSENTRVNARVRYIELIALKLTQLAYNLSDYDVPEVAGFTYDITQETSFVVDDVNYRELGIWYSSLEQDSQKPREELVLLARHVVSNRRFYVINSHRLDSLRQFSTNILDTFDRRSHLIYEEGDLLTDILIFIPIVIAFFCSCHHGLIFSTSQVPCFYNTFYHVFGCDGYCVYPLFNYREFASYNQGREQLIELTRNLSDLSESQEEFKAYSLSFVQNGDLNYYNHHVGLSGIIHRVADAVDSIIDLEHPQVSPFASQISVRLPNLTKSILALREHEVTKYLEVLVPMDRTWNLSQQDNYHELITNFGYFDWSTFYSDDVNDLNLGYGEQRLLARSILTSPVYLELEVIRDEFFFELLNFFSSESSSVNSDLTSSFRFIFTLCFGVIVGTMIVSSFSIYELFETFYSKRKQASHVRQVIKFENAISITRNYTISLLILAAGVVSFYVFASTTTLQSIPRLDNIHLASSRLLLGKGLYSSTTLLVDSENPASQSLIVLRDAEQLLQVHYRLLFGDSNSKGSIGTHQDQDSLLFSSGFTSNTTLVESGLHVNLAGFVDTVSRLATKQTVVLPNDPDFLQFLQEGDVLTSLLYESLELYRDTALSSNDTNANIILFMFVVLLLMLTSEYLFVFRKMVSKVNRWRRNSLFSSINAK
ncbi:hypothetical protein GEMRC1_008294 [Eukaryota sp. GEM-RC1]